MKVVFLILQLLFLSAEQRMPALVSRGQGGRGQVIMHMRDALWVGILEGVADLAAQRLELNSLVE